MSVDINLAQNSATFIHFQQLKQEDREPKLCVYRGRKLMILSYKANGLLEMIGNIFKQIVMSLLKGLGWISQDKDDIRSLKEQVREYYFNQVKKHQERDFQDEEQGYQDKIGSFQKKLDQIQTSILTSTDEQRRLSDKIKLTTHQEQEISDNIKKLKTENKQLETDHQAALTAIQQKQAAEQDVQKLNASKVALTSEIAQLKSAKDALQPTKDALEALEKKRDEVKSDVSQLDYKDRYEREKKEWESKINIMKRMYEAKTTTMKSVNEIEQQNSKWRNEANYVPTQRFNEMAATANDYQNKYNQLHLALLQDQAGQRILNKLKL